MFKSSAQKRFTFYLILPEPTEKSGSYSPGSHRSSQATGLFLNKNVDKDIKNEYTGFSNDLNHIMQ